MSEREIIRWVTVRGRHFPIYADEQGNEYFGVGVEDEKFKNPETTQDIYNLVVGKDSYVNDARYKDTSQKITQYTNESFANTDKIQALRKELKKETIEDESRKGLDRWERELLADKTPRGKEIEKEIKTLRERQSQLDSVRESFGNYLQAKDNQYKNEQIASFGNPSLKPASQSDYEGFQLDTATSYYQDAYEQGRAVIAEMSPKEYLQRIAYHTFDTTLEKTVRGANPKSVAKYAKEMREGTKYYMPVINYDNPGQEGRHRALAAIINGYEKIPVMIVSKRR